MADQPPTPAPPTGRLNFRGDLRHAEHEPLLRARDGALMVPTTASYDDETDLTTVEYETDVAMSSRIAELLAEAEAQR